MRAHLRIGELKQRPVQPRRLLNVAIPVKIHAAIAQLARKLGVSKTEVFVALVNEGLNVAVQQKKMKVDLGGGKGAR